MVQLSASGLLSAVRRRKQRGQLASGRSSAALGVEWAASTRQKPARVNKKQSRAPCCV